MVDRHTCPRCDGTGRAPLDLVLQATLDTCRKLASEGTLITAPAFPLDPNWIRSPTTINNRLDKLVRLGLLRRSGRQGGRVVYELDRVLPAFACDDVGDAMEIGP